MFRRKYDLRSLDLILVKEITGWNRWRCNDKVGQEYALWIKVRSTIIECKVAERMFSSTLKGPKFSNIPISSDAWFDEWEKKRIFIQNDDKRCWEKKLNRDLFHPINVNNKYNKLLYMYLLFLSNFLIDTLIFMTVIKRKKKKKSYIK